MIGKTRNKFFKRISVIGLAGILFACVNDLNDVKKITYDPKSPSEVTENLEVFYTDSGYPKIRLFAKLSETYVLPKQVTKFRKGLKVEFFDEAGDVVSILTSQYGEIRTEEGMMFVRDSVELFNIQKQQRLRTEELIWNQKDSLIYSNKSVVVTSPDGILYGKGIKTTQDFENYTFVEPKGKIKVK